MVSSSAVTHQGQSIVDLSKKEECNFSMIRTFNERYPKLFPFTDKELCAVVDLGGFQRFPPKPPFAATI